MSTKNTLPTSIEQLPNEIFFEIFGYFHLRELFKSAYGLNSRINFMIQSMKSMNHTVQYNDTDDVQLLPTFSKKIARLAIIKSDIVDLTVFSNLKSLTLKYPSSVQLKSIHPQNFPLLEILHIYAWSQTLMPQDVIEVHDLFELIFNNGFPRLRLCTALGVVPLTASVTWSLSPSLRFLYVPMKTAEDYERLPYICPNLQLFPSCKNRFVDPLNQIRGIQHRLRQQRIWTSINELNQLELERKFILEINPFAIFKKQRRQSYEQSSNSIFIHGRICLQIESCNRTLFLIEIEFLPEYPFKQPQITFLDRINNPNIDHNSKLSFRWQLSMFGSWKPTDHLVDILRKLTTINEQINLDNEKPPEDVAQQLLQYLDILYPNGEPINPVMNVGHNESPIYKNEVIQFFRLVDTYAQNFNYEIVPTYQMTKDPEQISRANWTEIKQMLTSISRAERWSVYSIAHAIEHGCIKWILLRLKQL